MNRIYFKGRSFYSFKDGKHVEDLYVQRMIDEVVDEMVHGESGDHFFTATGDTLVAGIRFEDEIAIFVTQSYDEATLILDKDGQWISIDYGEEKMSPERAEYNPRKEV